MRYSITCIIMLIVIVSFGQAKKPVSNLGSQLKQLTGLQKTGFKTIRKGTAVIVNSDSTFDSKITITGTRTNKIIATPYGADYEALIKDTSSAPDVIATYMDYEQELDKILLKTYKKMTRTIDDDILGVGEELYYIPLDGQFTMPRIVLSRITGDTKRTALKICVRRA